MKLFTNIVISTKAAKARSLRDRRTVNVEELEEATSHLKTGLRIIDPRIELPKRQNLSHSETMELIHARRYQGSKYFVHTVNRIWIQMINDLI